MRFQPRSPPRYWGRGHPIHRVPQRQLVDPPRAAQCPEQGSGGAGELRGCAGWGEAAPSPTARGAVEPCAPTSRSWLWGGGSACSVGLHPSAPASICPQPSLHNKYLYCAVQNTSASPPRREGSLPTPPVTWGTPCRVTAPAGSPARSPVSGCFAVH